MFANELFNYIATLVKIQGIIWADSHYKLKVLGQANSRIFMDIKDKLQTEWSKHTQNLHSFVWDNISKGTWMTCTLHSEKGAGILCYTMQDSSDTFDSFKVLISISSSSIFPSEVNSSLRILSSIALSWFLSELIRTISWFLWSSRSGLSRRTTSLQKAKHTFP